MVFGERQEEAMTDAKLREIFSKNLTHYLEINGYKQADLARHMKVSTATTAKWCTGQAIPRIDKIQSICNWLGVTKSDLLDPHDANDSIDRTDGQRPQYYLDNEAIVISQELFENPDLRVLFDAARGAKPENLRLAAEMLRQFKEGNKDG